MKFSGANLMMGFSKILKNSKISITFLVIVIILIIIAFNYFNESNRIRVMEVDFENIVTENQLPIDTLELSIICNLSGDFQLSNQTTETTKVAKDGFAIYADFSINDSILNNAPILFKMALPADSSSVKKVSEKIPYFDSISVYQTIRYQLKTKTPTKSSYKNEEVNNKWLSRDSYFEGESVRIRNITTQNNTTYLYDDGYKVKSADDKGISVTRYTRRLNYFSKYVITPRGLIHRNRNVSAINIKSLKIPNVKNVRIRFNYMTAMQFDALSVQPSYQTPNEIIYEGKEAIEQICKSGLFVYGHSLSNGRSIEMSNFILATLIGFLLSLVVEILYKIVEKNHSKE